MLKILGSNPTASGESGGLSKISGNKSPIHKGLCDDSYGILQ